MARATRSITLVYEIPSKEIPVSREFSWQKLAVCLALLLVFGCLGAVIVHRIYTPTIVASIDGPPGSFAVYELWWAESGDLSFRPANGRWKASYRRYSKSHDVVDTEWIDGDHLEMTMRDGAIVQVQLSNRMLTLKSAKLVSPRPATQTAGP